MDMWWFMTFQAEKEEPVSLNPQDCRHDGSLLWIPVVRKRLKSACRTFEFTRLARLYAQGPVE
jgi:hypothetical protein